MGLSEFYDILSPVILPFGGEIGDRSPYGAISLMRRHRFSCFAFL
jgi:hypothetical protein